MEKQLNLDQNLSLKEMALRKVVANLWTENDILAAIEEFRYINAGLQNSLELFQDYVKVWKNCVEHQVKNKVLNLVLPKCLKKQLTSLVRPIGSDILRWKSFHENYLSTPNEYFSMHFLKQLHWTCIGAIDYQKTAEKLICLKMLDSVKRYRLACHYCLVEHIPLLWKELDEESRSEFYSDDPFDIDMKMEYVWPYILKGEESVLEERIKDHLLFTMGESLNEFFLESEACLGNKAATEYFFQRLTHEQKDSALLPTVEAVVRSSRSNPLASPPNFKKERLADVLCYLLPMLTPEQQMQILREHPYSILNFFLDWPWHDLFFDTANIIWNFLPVSRYGDFHLILENSGYYFPTLVQKLLRNGPCTFVQQFLSQEHHHCYLHKLCFLNNIFDNEDTETIKEVFRNASAEDRVSLVSCFHFYELFEVLIANSKWHLLELCLHEAIKSEEEKKILKDRFMKFLKQPHAPKGIKGFFKLSEESWKRFYELLDETEISTPNKRSLEAEKTVAIKTKRSCY